MRARWQPCGGSSPADVLLHALPIFHIHGLFVAINVSLAAGSSLTLLPRFEPESVLRHLPHSTVMMGVPTYYVRLLKDARLNRELTAGCRVFISGSAPLLAETHREWFERTGHRLLERYGMSETGMNTSNPYDGERVPGSVGLPLPDLRLRIVDAPSGRPLPVGEIGLIEVRGPNVFAGYWRRPNDGARRVSGGWLFHDRRSRLSRCARLSLHRRSQQGSGHQRRLQHLSQGDRSGDRSTARCGRIGRVRRTASRLW